MPKVFEKDGYAFFFYSNEHRPILSRAQELAQENRQLILERWHEHLG